MTENMPTAARRNPIARRALLRRELAVRGAVSVAELGDILGASSATIRRDLDMLAREAQVGDAYCSKQHIEHVPDVSKDPDWDGNEFFTDPDRFS